VLRPEVTEAIRAAVFEELAAVGYARMSIEGIARRAGVGKTAVYRRWRSKLHLVLDLVSALAVQGLPAPDTGSLEADLRLLYEVTSRALRHPVAGQILPDLQAEAARNPEIAEALQKALREGQQ
jgi:AcrR family transcriptional regulator